MIRCCGAEEPCLPVCRQVEPHDSSSGMQGINCDMQIVACLCLEFGYQTDGTKVQKVSHWAFYAFLV